METKLKRFLIYTGTFLICFLLQTSVFEFFQLAHIRPNILLIFVVSFAFITPMGEARNSVRSQTARPVRASPKSTAIIFISISPFLLNA